MPEQSLRAIFNEDAARYDRARPGYPADLFRGLADLAQIGPGTRVAEIGPGTGQATAALVGQGAQVVGVELGAQLAAVLQRKLALLSASAEVVVSTFEDWALPREPFDAVVAFTAWHWLDSAVRTAKAAAALRPGGALATVTTFHVLGGSESFFTDVQDCYQRWDPATTSPQRLPAADEVPAALDEADHSELFWPAIRCRYQQDVTYTTSSYLDLLGTYSGHRALSQQRRQGLFGCISRLIDQGHGGTITKHYLYELRVAHRR